MVNEILVFIYPGFADFEITLSMWKFAENEDYEVLYIAYEKEIIKTNSGFKIIPDLLIKDIKSIQDIKALIIPDESLLDLKKSFEKLIIDIHNKKILIGAICAGPQYLAASGILNGNNSLPHAPRIDILN